MFYQSDPLPASSLCPSLDTLITDPITNQLPDHHLPHHQRTEHQLPHHQLAVTLHSVRRRSHHHSRHSSVEVLSAVGDAYISAPAYVVKVRPINLMKVLDPSTPACMVEVGTANTYCNTSIGMRIYSSFRCAVCTCQKKRLKHVLAVRLHRAVHWAFGVEQLCGVLQG